jgi:hypothetical protein
MKFTYENVVLSKEAHQRYIESRDSKNMGSGWSDTLKDEREVMERIEEECIDKDDVDLMLNVIDESLMTPHKKHIDGLNVLFSYSPELKEEVYERIDDWLSQYGITQLTVEQALLNIDAYQVTPLKRIVSFLYIVQLDEDDVLELLQALTFQPSINRLSSMHARYIKKNASPEIQAESVNNALNSAY